MNIMKLFKDKKVNALRSQLSWSHYRELLSIKDFDEIIYYINLAISNSLGYRELATRIKNNEYERLPIETKNKLILDDKLEVKDLVPNPILIRNKNNTETEDLHNNLLINIKNLIQLENGIEIDDNKIRVYLDEEELDKFSTNKEELEICEKVYISSDILLTSEQEETFENNNIEVYIIPEYYFEDEIMEVM